MYVAYRVYLVSLYVYVHLKHVPFAISKKTRKKSRDCIEHPNLSSGEREKKKCSLPLLS